MPKYCILTLGRKPEKLAPWHPHRQKDHLMQTLKFNSYETPQSIVFALLAIYWQFWGPQIAKIAIPGATPPPQIREDLSEMWPNQHAEFYADR